MRSPRTPMFGAIKSFFAREEDDPVLFLTELSAAAKKRDTRIRGGVYPSDFAVRPDPFVKIIKGGSGAISVSNQIMLLGCWTRYCVERTVPGPQAVIVMFGDEKLPSNSALASIDEALKVIADHCNSLGEHAPFVLCPLQPPAWYPNA